MNKKYDVYKPKIDDDMWIVYCGRPKKVHYDYMYGWIADVDDYDYPHTIIDWPFVLFNKFTNDVKKFSETEHYYGIGFTNANSCRAYCNWKYNKRRDDKYDIGSFTI